MKFYIIFILFYKVFIKHLG